MARLQFSLTYVLLILFLIKYEYAPAATLRKGVEEVKHEGHSKNKESNENIHDEDDAEDDHEEHNHLDHYDEIDHGEVHRYKNASEQNHKGHARKKLANAHIEDHKENAKNINAQEKAQVQSKTTKEADHKNTNATIASQTPDEADKNESQNKTVAIIIRKVTSTHPYMSIFNWDMNRGRKFVAKEWYRLLNSNVDIEWGFMELEPQKPDNEDDTST